jgi:transposase
MRTAGSTEELQRVRMIAVNMFEREVPPKQIAADLGVDDQTVRRWRRVWRAKGRDGLLGKAHPGRPRRLDDAQRRELAEALRQKPTEHGFQRHLWTTELIRDFIQQRFNVSYHHDWVGELMHQIGFTWQKPMRRARERDEAAIAAWRETFWPDLLKKVPTPTA